MIIFGVRGKYTRKAPSFSATLASVSLSYCFFGSLLSTQPCRNGIQSGWPRDGLPHLIHLSGKSC